MRTELRQLLTQHQDALVTHIVDQLRQGGLAHYGQLDPALLRTRIERLVGQFLASLEDGPQVFVDFMSDLAEQRLAEGYFLDEIQAGLNLLDERACDIALRESDERRVDEDLLRICRTISLAKDTLARAYFRRKQEAEERLAAVQDPPR